MHALAHAGPEQRPVVAALVGARGQAQDAAGAWPNADLFQTLEALLAPRGLPEAREPVRRAVPALHERQRADGTFGGIGAAGARADRPARVALGGGPS